MKAEADLHFLQGINQLIGHGWPYSPPNAGEPGWRFYAAAVFNNHNPWWIVMPEIAKYLQRVSFLLRQGKPANDIALYLPTEDAWSGFTLGKDSVNQSMGALLGPDLIPRILDAGFNFDFIDDRAIDKAGIPYPVLVLPALKRMPKETTLKLDEFRKRGGIVVDAAHIGDLAHLYTPDFATGDAAIGFIHRKLEDADVYFVVNTGNQPVHTTARVRVEKGWEGDWWDPMTGRATPAGTSAINLNFEPYESRVLVFSKHAGAADRSSREPEETLDISSDWTVEFPVLKHSVDMHQLRSWSDDEDTKFFSGQAIYAKTVAIPDSLVRAGREVLLNFGEGTPSTPSGRPGPGMRAWLESPVHEAAVVYVNGQRAGVVWRPPYEIEVTKLVKAGENLIHVEVGNLAINRLAGQSPPDYKLLNLRYGVRFQAQDMESLRPLPSGLLGPIRVISR